MINLDYGYLDEKNEYHGQYEGCRVLCRDCKFSSHEIGLGESQKHCNKFNVNVKEGNNVCKKFQPRIINPSHKHTFNFNAYFEWLMNDFYRPWTINKNEIIGSAKLGFVKIDGGRLAELMPDTYSPLYKSYDLPRCSLNMPHPNIQIGKYHFLIDYRHFRKGNFINNNEIKYKKWYYKEKPKSRKYTVHYNGEININELEE